MRILTTLGLVAIAGAGLAACQDEATQRAEIIRVQTEGCIRGFESNSRPGAVPAGMDGTRICNCAIEKVSEGKSVAELKTMFSNDGPSPDEARLMGACLTEEARRAGVIGQ